MSDRLDPDSDYTFDALNQPQVTHTRVKVCIECEGLATHNLSGAPLCFDHFQEQEAVVMGLFLQQLADERRDDR